MLSHNKVGGIHFLRLGRLRLSYCVARATPKASAEPWQPDWIDSALVAASVLAGLLLGLVPWAAVLASALP
jgi:hypothetical protein